MIRSESLIIKYTTFLSVLWKFLHSFNEPSCFFWLLGAGGGGRRVDQGMQKKRTDFIIVGQNCLASCGFYCPFCCVSECLETIYVALRLFFFQKFLHLKFSSQQSAGCLLRPYFFRRPFTGSLMAYSSNQKFSYSKSLEGSYSSWPEERGLKQWANPSRFHSAVPPESSLPQTQAVSSLPSHTCDGFVPWFCLAHPWACGLSTQLE